jgi:hypothetical protein
MTAWVRGKRKPRRSGCRGCSWLRSAGRRVRFGSSFLRRRGAAGMAAAGARGAGDRVYRDMEGDRGGVARSRSSGSPPAPREKGPLKRRSRRLRDPISWAADIHGGIEKSPAGATRKSAGPVLLSQVAAHAHRARYLNDSVFACSRLSGPPATSADACAAWRQPARATS